MIFIHWYYFFLMFKEDQRIVGVYGQCAGQGKVCECGGNCQQGPEGGTGDGEGLPQTPLSGTNR